MDFKKMTIYQIYIKSFYDSNDDGIGDLKGIEEKLPYLYDLGVKMLWITPFYSSPMYDNGYDVADYLSVDKQFGTMADLKSLIAAAEKFDIGIMLDMVFNHSSTYHSWFQNALKGSEEYRNYYYFFKTDSPPTNWISKFGGSAWEYVEELDMYYLHLFHKYQADLNWENPALREKIFGIVNNYLEMGVKGFRFDVINLISKPDVFEDDDKGDGRRFYTDGPRIHKYLREMNSKTFGKMPGIVTVGEMSSTNIENCKRYSNPNGDELSMVFNFHHLKVDYKDGEKWSLMDFDFIELKRLLFTWQVEMQTAGAWQALFWSNHDQPRIVSRFGDDSYHAEAAKAFATALYFMRGTNYIYQGEEIGMKNPGFTSIDDYKDVESLNYYKILSEKGVPKDEILKILSEKSRDNSRTPMQWNDNKFAGFSKTEPWIKVSNSYKDINVENQVSNANSILGYYKRIISLNTEDLFAYGDIVPILENHPSVLGYFRILNGQKVLVLTNFYPESISLCFDDLSLGHDTKFEIVLSNYPHEDYGLKEDISLKPYGAIVLQIS